MALGYRQYEYGPLTTLTTKDPRETMSVILYIMSVYMSVLLSLLMTYTMMARPIKSLEMHSH